MSVIDPTRFRDEDWIPAAERAWADAALRTLRPLIPLVAQALQDAWGADWQTELYQRLSPPFPTQLKDIRFLLKVMGSDPRLEPNPVRDLFPDLVPELADSLRSLVNKAHHEDDQWQRNDADRAEHLARAILTCTTPLPETAFAAATDHHQEVFRVGPGGSLHHRWFPDREHPDYPEGRWSHWVAMEAEPTSAVAAVGIDDSLCVFILARDGRVEQRTWTTSDGWCPWRTLPQGGQAVTGPLHALSRERGHLELFATGESGDLVHRWAWDDAWSPWVGFETPG